MPRPVGGRRRHLFVAPVCVLAVLASFDGSRAQDLGTAATPIRIGPTAPDGEELERVRLLALSPDGRRVATTGEPSDPTRDRRVRVWDTTAGELVHTFVTPAAIVSALDFSPDSRQLLTVTADHPAGAQVWDLATGDRLSATSGGNGTGRFRDDGQVQIVERFGTRDAVLVIDPKTGVERQRFPIRTHLRSAFSNDGRRMLFVERPRTPTIYVNDIETNTRVATLAATEGEPRSVALSPDGRIAAAIDGDAIVLWEIATASGYWGIGPVGDSPGLITRLEGHEKPVLRLAFSPDGRQLVTGSADHTVRIWDVASGSETAVLRGHESLVTALGISADGTRVASGSFDRTVLVQDVTKYRPRPSADPAPDAEALDKLWTDLGSTEPGTAYAALGRIAGHPSDIALALSARVHGTLVPAENERIRELVVQLDDDDYRVRHRAMLSLKKVRGIARPILLEAYDESLSEEVRNRIRRILRGDKNVPRFDETDRRRIYRIVQAAESIANESDARTRDTAIALIREVVAEFPDERIVADAKQALERLER